MRHLFVYGILPEVVGKWYSRKPAANSNNAVVVPDPPSENDEHDEDYEKGLVLLQSAKPWTNDTL